KQHLGWWTAGVSLIVLQRLELVDAVRPSLHQDLDAIAGRQEDGLALLRDCEVDAVLRDLLHGQAHPRALAFDGELERAMRGAVDDSPALRLAGADRQARAQPAVDREVGLRRHGGDRREDGPSS